MVLAVLAILKSLNNNQTNPIIIIEPIIAPNSSTIIGKIKSVYED